jgi:hypothetical protein
MSSHREFGEKSMKHCKLTKSILLLVFLVTATHQVEGWDNFPEPAVDSKQTDDALKILSRSTRFIEAAKAFSANGNYAGELILENGQLVEYGSTFTFIFSRPAKLYMRLNAWDGNEATMFFDGETITVAAIHDGRHIYGTVPQPGDVNESLDFMVSKTGGPRELNFFLTEQMTSSLNRLRSGILLGKSTINGVLCDHLAVRSDTRDGQVWVERGAEPRPWRILITHREETAQPRFWIQFDKWDFSPEFSESTFKYTPPEDAVKFHYFND